MILTTDSTLADELWSGLQEPARVSSNETRYQLLLSALDTGWRVEEPVYLRPRWSDNGPRVYHFILRRSTQTTQRLLTVPESPLIERFVQNEGLQIVA